MTVLTQVRERIVTGAIPAGARLTAEIIARDLDVSRTPVRSALAVLAAEGLASYAVNRGYTVKTFTLRDVLDAIETRAALQALSTRISVEYGWDQREIDRLTEAVTAARALVDKGTWSEEIEWAWHRAVRDFHSLILGVSRNSALRNALRMTLIHPLFGDVARICPAVAKHIPQRHRTLPATTPDHIRTSQDEIERVHAAIVAGAADQAEQLMRDHVMSSRERLANLATRR